MLTPRTIALQENITRMNDAGVRKTTFYTMAAQSLKSTQGQPRQLRRAKAFAHILENVALEVHPYELIGGSITGMWPLDPDVPDFDTQYAMAVDAVEDYIAHRDDPIDAQEISLRFEVQAARAADGRFALMARDHFNGNIDFQRLQKVNALLKEKYAGSRKITPAEIVKVTEDFFNYDYGAETMSYIDELPWLSLIHI